MNRRLLAGLLAVNLLNFCVGHAMMSLLPIYVSELGAPASAIGLFFAGIFAAMTVGTLLGGRLMDRQVHVRTIFLTGPIAVVPCMLGLGQVNRLWMLFLLAALIWLVAGITLASVGISAGRSTQAGRRGAVFGMLALTTTVGQMIGGLISGPIVETWGYAALFVAAALLYSLQLPAALLSAPHPHTVDGARPATDESPSDAPSYAIGLLMLAALCSHVVVFASDLGRPLAMHALGFNPTAITSISVHVGCVTLPLPFLIGRLSDKIGHAGGRQTLLLICFAVVGSGAWLLAHAVGVWNFRAAAMLIAMNSTAVTLGSALIADWTPVEQLGRQLARFQSLSWIGAVIGFSLAGRFIQFWGFAPTFKLSALLALVAVMLIGSLALSEGLREVLRRMKQSAPQGNARVNL